MAKKKSKTVDNVKTRARRAVPKAKATTPAKKTAAKKQASTSTRTKKATVPQPPKKLFDAFKWCGVLPELAGDSLKIQRKLRDEWTR